MLFGIAHFSAVFFALRLLSPGRVGPPLMGVVFAAFLPMQLCLSHYITNETLAATLASVAIFLALRLLLKPTDSALGYMALGAVLGAAMLTKVTAILLVPPMFIALGAGHVVRRTSFSRVGANNRDHGRHIRRGVQLALHPYSVSFGTPFVWSGAGRVSWWQDSGVRTLADYPVRPLDLGPVLQQPLSVLGWNLLDRLGRRIVGRRANIVQRTPWNYDLMTGGYLLALVPAALILIGAFWAFSFLRRPSVQLFLLLSFTGVMMAALILLSLNAAGHFAVKGFYGLSGLVPLRCFRAGWNLLSRSRPILREVLTCLLLIWAINSFASVWIRDSAARGTYAGPAIARR